MTFERTLHAAVGRTVDAAWGHAYLAPALHRVYDLNFLWIRGDAAGLEAATLDGEADRLIGGAGMTHRRLLLEAPADARLGEDLAALGYERSRHVYLALGSDPPMPPRADVEVGGVDDMVDALERYLRTDPDTAYGRDDTTRAHLVDHARVYPGDAAQQRVFLVRDEGGEVAAWAKLWLREGVAQVEDVVCLHEHRGRGFGRDVVAAATRAAVESGAEMVFIVADDADWPKDLYARMGYAPIGHIGLALRHTPPRG